MFLQKKDLTFLCVAVLKEKQSLHLCPLHATCHPASLQWCLGRDAGGRHRKLVLVKVGLFNKPLVTFYYQWESVIFIHGLLGPD